jgi:hypothetical protein
MASVPDVVLRFERGQATADELQATIDEILEELRDPLSDAAREASLEGLNPVELGAATITVEETDQGVVPVVAAILVGVAVNAGYDVAKQGWKSVIWPRVEKRLGGLALGDELPQADAQDEKGTGSGAEKPGQ